VEVYQNCVIFNDGAFANLTEPDKKPENALYLENGQPMLFGKEKNKGIRLNGWKLEVVEIQDESQKADILIHDETPEDPAMAFLLAEMTYNDELPTPIGIFLERQQETYEELYQKQVEEVTHKFGKGDMKKLLLTGDIWTVD